MFFRLFFVSFVLQNKDLKMNTKWLYNSNKFLSSSLLDELQIDNKTNNMENSESIEEFLDKKESKKRFFLNNGMDYRNNETNYNEIIFNITDFMHKQELLERLMDNKISDFKKLEAIKNYRENKKQSEYLINLKAGKLMEDWIKGTDGSP
jgi:hypothetical protein